MRYSWPKEKKLGIKPARNPISGFPLSGVVILKEDGIGYCFISFTKYTVEAIGKKMPYGIGPENTAYLKILKKGTHYDIMCTYTDKSKTVALWKTKELPEWVQEVRYHDTKEDT